MGIIKVPYFIRLIFHSEDNEHKQNKNKHWNVQIREYFTLNISSLKPCFKWIKRIRFK